MKALILMLLLSFTVMAQKPDPVTSLQRAKMQLMAAGIVSLELPKAIDVANRYAAKKATADDLHNAIIKAADEITVATYQKPFVTQQVMLNLQLAEPSPTVSKSTTKTVKKSRAWVCYDLKTRKAQSADYCHSHPKDSMLAVPR